MTTPTVQRWKFEDAGESYTVPINPNQMEPVHPAKNVQVHGTVRTSGHSIVFEGDSQPVSWNFGGVILHADHYANLLHWVNKNHRIWLTDHYGRKMEVYLTQFKPVPKTPQSRKYPWKHDYSITALIFSVGDPLVDDTGVIPG